MADAPKQNALMKFGPIGAPALGALLMIVFVLVALVLGDTDGPKRRIDDAVSKINSRLAEPKVSDPPPEFKAEGLKGANKSFGTATGGKIPAKVDKEHLLMDLPVQIKVMLDVPPIVGGGFDASDVEPKDGYLSRDEYFRSDKYKKKVKFKTLDTNKDNRLTLSEYEATPDETIRAFDWLDQEGATNNTDDGDDKLSKQEYERTLNPETRSYEVNGNADFGAKDKDSDAYLSRVEYGKVITEQVYDIAAPTEVTAAADQKAFTITVKWTAGAMKNPPPDLVYVIERYSPGDVAERTTKHRQELTDYQKALRKWEDDYKSWKKQPGNENKTPKDYEQSQPKPIRPPDVSVWARMPNVVAGTETQYVDTDFATNFTYKYRVTAATASDTKLTPDSKLASKQSVEGKKHSDWGEQAIRPVSIQNRIEMSWNSKGENTARVRLTKFHSIEGKWMAVEVIQELNLGDDVGGNWTVADMQAAGFKVQVLGADGKPDTAPLKALEASKARIDFRTTWQFNGFSGSDIILTQKGGTGKYVLPKETNKPATEVAPDPSTMSNPIALRVSGLDAKAGTARFEITRWEQIDKGWYRVVIIHEVKKDVEIGMVAGTAKEVWYYDDGGDPVKDATVLAKLKAVDLSTGLKLSAISGRIIEFDGGVKMDIQGVYYVDR